MASRLHASGPLDAQAVEERTQQIGRELFQRATRHHEHLSVLNRWTKQVLGWCLADRELKARILRFLDVLPSLKTPRAVVRHVRDYFPTGALRLPPALRLGVSLSRQGLLTAPAASLVVQQLVEQVARQFIAGTSLADAASVLKQMASQGVLVSFDLLGERVVSDREAEDYVRRYLSLIRTLSEAGRMLEMPGHDPRRMPLVHVSVKPSSLSSHVDPLDFGESIPRALDRLRPIAQLAAEVGSSITLDMEQYELRDVTLELAKQLLWEPPLGERIQLGVVIQAYLTDAEAVTTEILRWLSTHNRRLSIRLVKGAYWDSEVAQAKQRGWSVPVFLEKWRTDEAFERLTRQLLAAHPMVRTEIASHNVRSIAHAMAVAEALGCSKDQLEFQLLYGMGDAIQAAIGELGYPVRVYTPVGELIPGMAYLVRRILENTANESFLRQDLWAGAAVDDLLKPPGPEQDHSPSSSSASPGEAFIGEPFANFANHDERTRFQTALDDVLGELGDPHRRPMIEAKRCPLLIGGKEIQTGRWIRSVDPSDPDRVVGQVAQAGLPEVEQAVEIATDAHRHWARTAVEERVALLCRAAQLMRAQRYRLAALEVVEVGKPWREADADVVEAIDYLEYYSRQMLELAAGKVLAQRPGESNRYLYTPRGVSAVIAPWNFPLAILAGMSSAALVAGNAVILKPAEQSSVIAYAFARLLHEAGIPKDAVQYLSGLGEEVGAALVRHPGVALILFTGSKAVGLSIVEAAATISQGQRVVKHAVVEMGGKNAVIVDDDADLDSAIHGILVSAFSFSGQKCSAASRLIVHEAVAEPLIARLIGAVDALAVRSPLSRGCDMGPLIDEAAYRRVTDAIARARREATLLYQYPADRLPPQGYFVGPAVVADVDPKSPLAQEELFGPVLCLFRARSFSEAMGLANASEFGLTGGVYSRSPSHIEQAIRDFDVGNLYLNRPITGAIVGRQPFGGSKLSGLGTKAGGPDYLLQLVIPKTVCENTTRHGMPLE